MVKFLTKRSVILLLIVTLFAISTFIFFPFIKSNKKTIAISSLALVDKISKFLPIEEDAKNEIDAVNQLVAALTKQDNIERRFLILLQNNLELRPGGGFLGQYAIIKLKNGEVISTFFEDANLLDQKISSVVAPPYPFKRMLQLKNWKFRDSNFSPDFPTNVEKAKFFYRLSGGNSSFDGVIAVNSNVLTDILKLTGPISVPGYPEQYTAENAVLKLEEKVEKAYIMNPEIDTQNRKAILKKMTPVVIDKLFTFGNMAKLIELTHTELKSKNIMVSFADPDLQKIITGVHWDGTVAEDWGSDFLMLSEANMGALKSNYYISRDISYDIDLTQEKPRVTLNIIYKHAATYGDWRTSDYHAYLRIYVPKGSNFLEREMVSLPITQDEFGKTYFGVIVHVLIGHETHAKIVYELPASVKENYRLLIQKQSGVDNTPVKIHLKTNDGDSNQEAVLNKDLKFEFKKD